MKNAEAILVIKFTSKHSPTDLMKTCVEDLELFRNVPGLIQKYYLTEDVTGAISGFYVFETQNDRAAFWNSELAGTIGARYRVMPDTLRVEHYDMAIVLQDTVRV
jgi:hypothetical protein